MAKELKEVDQNAVRITHSGTTIWSLKPTWPSNGLCAVVW